MRVEVREVTVAKSIFIADDGTEFQDSTKCRNYEIGLLEKVVELYDDDFERADLHTCTFLHIKNQQDVENLRRLANYCGMTDKGVDDTPGVYMWNNKWIKISELVDTVKRLSEEAACNVN